MESEKFRADNDGQARAHGFTPAVRSAVYRSGTAKRDPAVSFTHGFVDSSGLERGRARL